MSEAANSKQKEKVKIHINREPYESVSPTTGAALYKLASIPKHQELFQEVTGDEEDRLIPDNDDALTLHPNDHFYSVKAFKIIVNGRPKEVTKKILSFDEIVALAFEIPPNGQNVLFTITYTKAAGKHPEGTLVEGGTVKIKEGTIFNVTATDKS